MPAIHVRDVPAPVIAALRERAARHGRSMQQEIRDVLETAAQGRAPAGEVEPVRLTTVRTSVTSAWRREEIYDDAGR